MPDTFVFVYFFKAIKLLCYCVSKCMLDTLGLFCFLFLRPLSLYVTVSVSACLILWFCFVFCLFFKAIKPLCHCVSKSLSACLTLLLCFFKVIEPIHWTGKTNIAQPETDKWLSFSLHFSSLLMV